MKFIHGFTGEYYVYKKEKEDFLNKQFILNILDLKMNITDILKNTLDVTGEILLKHNSNPLLEDETYTDGNVIYNKQNISDINQLLSILKNTPLFPLVDDIVINEPLEYLKIKRYLDSGLITNEYNYNKISETIVKDLINVTLIDNNNDKDYITNSFGLTYENNPVYLEEEHMLDDIKYTYYIVDKLSGELNVKDAIKLFSDINGISSDLFNKIIKILDKSDIKKFGTNTVVQDNTLIINKTLPYSSLRAKVTKELLTGGRYEDSRYWNIDIFSRI